MREASSHFGVLSVYLITRSSLKAFVRPNRCQNCRLLVDRCMCHELTKITCEMDIKLLLHSRELARVSNTGIIASRIVDSITEIHYGTPGYRFKALDVVAPEKLNLVLHPDAGRSLEEYRELGVRPSEINLVVPDGNWPQASNMTRKLVSSGLFKPVRLEKPVGGRYWLRIDHNHMDGVSTLEAIASALEVMGNETAGDALRRAFDKFVHESLLIRGKKALAQKFFGSSRYMG